ncbi:MAG: Uma2 family endonuclease [Nitrospirae bacterium]|nr:Uma2 family endonuclease [Nitrospirota bacterium]
MSALAPVKFTYEDYCLLPEDKRYELIEGDLYMTPAPATRHQSISKYVLYAFVSQLERTGMAVVFNAPIDVYLSDENVVQPDVLAIAIERKGIVKEKYIRGAPDLVVEILSSEHPERDRTIKRKLYHKFGVKEYWIVDPEARSVEIWSWDQDGFKLAGSSTTGAVTSHTFPSLSIPVAEIFG